MRSSSTRLVLLVEDNEDAAEALRQVLELSGYEVVVALRGQEALDAAAERPPDVVLCDLGLPGGMSGFAVARELRANPRTRGLRIIALTGFCEPEDIERTERSGFDGHLTKPVDLRALKVFLEGGAA